MTNAFSHGMRTVQVDSLAELVDNVPIDVKQSLVYTAGYVVRGHKPDSAVGAGNMTKFNEEYGSYTDALKRRVSRSFPILFDNG